MPSTNEQTKKAILKHGGKASKHQIARELKISLDYAGLICRELKRKGEVSFSDGFYVLTPLEARAKGAAVVSGGLPLSGLTSVKKNASQDKEQKKLATPSKRPKRVKKTKKPRSKKRAPHLSSILGISELLARTLEKAGYNTIESLAEAPISKLMDTAKLKLYTAAQLINKARKTK